MSYCPSVSLLSLSLAPVHAQAEDDRNFEFVKQVETQHEDSFFQLNNVYAVGIGKEGNRFVIDMYADPAVKSRLPTSLDRVMIRFNESGPFYASAAAQTCDNKATFPPPNIPIGVSTSNTMANATGTLGFRVVKQGIPLGPEVVGTYGYITANHVAAGPCWDQKSIGEDQFQAGKADNPNGNKIGDLESVVPVIRGLLTFNEVDAAFVKVSGGSTIGAGICGLGTRTTMPVSVGPGDIVFKSGRTTRVTQGQVVSVSVTQTITLVGCGTARFIDQILVKPTSMSCPQFSDQGDSGAPVVAEFNDPVGIVISDNEPIFGCSTARTTVTPIRAILNAFGVDLY